VYMRAVRIYRQLAERRMASDVYVRWNEATKPRKRRR